MTSLLAVELDLNVDRAAAQLIVVDAHQRSRAADPSSLVELNDVGDFAERKRKKRKRAQNISDAFSRRVAQETHEEALETAAP